MLYLDDEKGNLTYQLSEEGDTVADMLHYVKLNPAVLLERFRTQVKNAKLDKSTPRAVPN